MPKVDVYNINGDVVGDIELSDDIFGIEVNTDVLHEVVKAQLNNKRQGTQSALTRAEVRGGGAKPWRQKGTGRARAGGSRIPQWYHGGVVFAPKPRSYRVDVNKKVRRLALKSALSDKAASAKIIVLDELSLAEPKTREMVKVLDNLKVERKALVVINEPDTDVSRASSNLKNCKLTLVTTLNVLDILNHDQFIITKQAVEKVQEVYA
jgi:large subunit ribosomal protein L4